MDLPINWLKNNFLAFCWAGFCSRSRCFALFKDTCCCCLSLCVGPAVNWWLVPGCSPPWPSDSWGRHLCIPEESAQMIQWTWFSPIRGIHPDATRREDVFSSFCSVQWRPWGSAALHLQSSSLNSSPLCRFRGMKVKRTVSVRLIRINKWKYTKVLTRNTNYATS